MTFIPYADKPLTFTGYELGEEVSTSSVASVLVRFQDYSDVFGGATIEEAKIQAEGAALCRRHRALMEAVADTEAALQGLFRAALPEWDILYLTVHNRNADMTLMVRVSENEVTVSRSVYANGFRHTLHAFHERVRTEGWKPVDYP